jgi:hypothetical protein
MSRAAIIIVAVLCSGISLVGAVIWYASEQFSSCHNTTLSSTISPDGSKAVFVFRHECNATVAFSTYASIAPTDRSFSADRDRAFLGFTGTAEVLASWKGDDVVEIALIPGGAPFIRHEERFGNVKIDYK